MLMLMLETELHGVLCNCNHSPGRRHCWLLAQLHLLATACAAPQCQAGCFPIYRRACVAGAAADDVVHGCLGLQHFAADAGVVNAAEAQDGVPADSAGFAVSYDALWPAQP